MVSCPFKDCPVTEIWSFAGIHYRNDGSIRAVHGDVLGPVSAMKFGHTRRPVSVPLRKRNRVCSRLNWTGSGDSLSDGDVEYVRCLRWL